MSIENKFKGIIVPAVTPLKEDWAIDEAAVERIFNNFYAHNASPFILGTTGEAPSLSFQQKKDYVMAAVKFKKPGSVLYAGVSSNVIGESVDFANYCADKGVDAVAATLPSYYVLTESQMKQYFEDLANAISVPLIIYNIPATTHMSIPLSVIDELSHHPNIVATKDSERSDERLQQSLQLWKNRSDFGHFLGWAARSADALLGGSDGLIPSTGNVFPGIYQKMQEAVEAENKDLAYEMQQHSDTGGNLYQSGRTLGESLWALKVLMQQRGLCEAVVMPPLQPQSDEQATQLIQHLQQINFN
ncbi:dihydrodipicolinate synthase family protein [Niabella yanshanensis]|uniref:Dihydrodipicolinate synthase family protein n=1 Tax=Niabella yanshanensis TaxID=577386 RepID=A0ABZ0W9E9_9BACT|nr:dihydrodipicolinate synthase family protein [Niabella yanshanensis]WQD39223.1 dihydrodipicolinate synthase family protein [Niabella yanshanensis]